MTTKTTTPSATKTAGAAASLKTPTAISGNALYLHIPFCKKKCPYCHFFVVKDGDREPFLRALRREIAFQSPLFGPLRSLYFGGGTPSLLTPKELASIITIPRGIEVTLEANPDDITEEKLAAWRDLGINRLSIGVQSLHEGDLIQIGRIHTAKKARDAILLAGRYFDNISIDLMYDLPSQTLGPWKQTLSALRDLPITHLSLYNMTIEEGTPFHRKKSSLTLPDDDTSYALHQEALSLIPLPRYEISAFGTPSVHNTGYWKGLPFFGLGPSAFSYQNGARYQNVPNLKAYCETIQRGALPVHYHERLDPDARRRELLAIHLRLLSGVDLPAFEKAHGPLSPETKNTLTRLEEEGLLEGTRLTPRGALFYNDVASALI